MKYILLFTVLLLVSCKGNSINSINDEINKNTCGKNTISAKTSFGTFCSGFAELGGIDNCKNEYTFYYIFRASENRLETFTIIFTINSAKKGNPQVSKSQLIVSKQGKIDWDIENIPNYPFITPLKTTVNITDSSQDFMTGTFEIDINGKDKINCYFNELKIVKWSTQMGICTN